MKEKTRLKEQIKEVGGLKAALKGIKELMNNLNISCEPEDIRSIIVLYTEQGYHTHSIVNVPERDREIYQTPPVGISMSIVPTETPNIEEINPVNWKPKEKKHLTMAGPKDDIKLIETIGWTLHKKIGVPFIGDMYFYTMNRD